MNNENNDSKHHIDLEDVAKGVAIFSSVTGILSQEPAIENNNTTIDQTPVTSSIVSTEIPSGSEKEIEEILGELNLTLDNNSNIENDWFEEFFIGAGEKIEEMGSDIDNLAPSPEESVEEAEEISDSLSLSEGEEVTM